MSDFIVFVGLITIVSIVCTIGACIELVIDWWLERRSIAHRKEMCKRYLGVNGRPG